MPIDNGAKQWIRFQPGQLLIKGKKY